MNPDREREIHRRVNEYHLRDTAQQRAWSQDAAHHMLIDQAKRFLTIADNAMENELRCLGIDGRLAVEFRDRVLNTLICGDPEPWPDEREAAHRIVEHQAAARRLSLGLPAQQ